MDHPRERRVVIKAPVSFEGKSGTGKGTTFNLSLGGCALEGGADVKMDATIKMNLHIPNEKKPVRVGRAKVIWTAGDDFGVEFLNMDQTGKARLQHYIEGVQKKVPSKNKS
ncbi:MAG: PilZ domain-containing protein [Nitrospirae bacterium]|nr:PilZ domain-containing protein [Nitrospirota bacterium]